MLNQSEVCFNTFDSAPKIRCKAIPKTIPIPKALNTRLGNEICFLAIMFNIIMKIINTTTLIIVKSASIS